MKGQMHVQFFDKGRDEQNNNERHVAVRPQEDTAWKYTCVRLTYGALSNLAPSLSRLAADPIVPNVLLVVADESIASQRVGGSPGRPGATSNSNFVIHMVLLIGR
jgi:hypothetical protein